MLALLSSSPAAAQGAGAAEPDRVASLDYRGPEQCPPAVRLVESVAARIGRVPFAPRQRNVVRVRLLLDGSEWMATLELDGTARVFRASACADVVEALAVALSVFFEPIRDEAIRDEVVIIRSLAVQDGNQSGLGGMVGDAMPPPEAVRRPEPQRQIDDERDDRGNLVAGVPVRVSLSSNEDYDAVTLHRLTHTGSSVASVGGVTGMAFERYYERLCVLPCEARLSLGGHQLALSTGHLSPAELPDLVQIDGPSAVHIEHYSRGAIRAVGGIVALAGLVTLLIGAVGPLFAEPPVWGSLLIGGGVGMITGVCIGAFVTDDIDVRVTPGA